MTAPRRVSERGGPSGARTTFSFTLCDGTGNHDSTGPGGSIVTIVINPDGSTTDTAYSPSSAGGPTTTVTRLGTVPGPSTLLWASSPSERCSDGTRSAAARRPDGCAGTRDGPS